MATQHTQGQPHDRIESQQDVKFASPSRPLDVETSLSQKMVSATIGSVLTSLLVTPLDVVRVRLQAQQSPSPAARLPSFVQLPPNLGVSACCREVFWVQNQSQFCVAAPTGASLMGDVASDCAAEETQRRTINSTMDGLRKIARNEGMSTLWRGLSPTLAMAVPGNIVYFAGYDWLRTSASSPMSGRVSDVYAPLVAGSVARVLAAVVVSPIEMLRTRMQAAQTSEKNVLRATVGGLREMVTSQGYSSLWRGLTLTFWRDVPFSALYWWGYEYGRERLREARHRTDGLGISTGEAELSHSAILIDSFTAGAASGAIAALVTTPFDVGKTRQQTTLHGGSTARNLPENQVMPKFLWHIYKTEGVSGLFKGWSARCLKVAPACAIMISSYEIGKKMAVMVNERRDEDLP